MAEPRQPVERPADDSLSGSSAEPESWDERPDTDRDTEHRYEQERPPHHGD
ncbi:MAG: hypothetical protein WCI74_11565 [Actinomycetes bacterium]